MHLVIPFASVLQTGVLQALPPLPNLETLIRLSGSTGQPVHGDELSPQMPHEHLLATLRGDLSDRPATAAWHAAQDGVATGQHAWMEITPIHLAVSTDQISAVWPNDLQDSESQVLWEQLSALFPENEGWLRAYGCATRWYVAHERCAGAVCASLDRVMGRSVDVWMPDAPQARFLRTLQNEAQMVLHGLAVNDEREARGTLPVNSVWFSGCGRAPPQQTPPAAKTYDALRLAAMQSDWQAWIDAWARLDSIELAAMVAMAQVGTPPTISLCGERSYIGITPKPRSWGRRIKQALSTKRPAAITTLEAL